MSQPSARFARSAEPSFVSMPFKRSAPFQSRSITLIFSQRAPRSGCSAPPAQEFYLSGKAGVTCWIRPSSAAGMCSHLISSRNAKSLMPWTDRNSSPALTTIPPLPDCAPPLNFCWKRACLKFRQRFFPSHGHWGSSSARWVLSSLARQARLIAREF